MCSPLASLIQFFHLLLQYYTVVALPLSFGCLLLISISTCYVVNILNSVPHWIFGSTVQKEEKCVALKMSSLNIVKHHLFGAEIFNQKVLWSENISTKTEFVSLSLFPSPTNDREFFFTIINAVEWPFNCIGPHDIGSCIKCSSLIR